MNETDLKYDATLHFPVEQYGYAEVHIQVSSPEEAIQTYKAATTPQTGIEMKDMNMIVDKMLLGQQVEGGIEFYEKMSPEQKYAVQQLKKALKRLVYRHEKENKDSGSSSHTRDD